MRPVVFFLISALVAPTPMLAQDTAPPSLAEVEAARSRACVGALERMGELSARVEPLALKANRLRVLNQAIALEDSTEAAPFGQEPVESAVRAWFVADAAMGARYAETQDSAVAVQRAEAKAGIRARLQEAMDAIRVRADTETADAEEIEAATMPCQGVVFVRPAVLEECRATSSETQLCEAAADTARSPLFRFVDDAEDLWQVEELRPWSAPGPLQVAPDGSLVGARTAALSRLGNVVVAVAFSPMIRERAQLDSAQAAEFDANLEALGFAFDDPRFVMVPAFEVQANLPAPLGGETHYLLHFGELSAPEVVWSLPAGSGGITRAAVPLQGPDLEKLRSGEPLSFTAVKLSAPPQEGQPPEGEFVFSLGLTQVNQAQSTSGLVEYLAQGGLAADLKRIVPPTSS